MSGSVLIIGAQGQLGQALVAAFSDLTVHAPTHAELEITNAPQVRACIERIRPDVVINTSAFHDVPRCETEPVIAQRTNGLGPQLLASHCRRVGSRFYHVSTDYVFDGAKGSPYVERDAPRPLNIYGETKLTGERLALAAHRDTIIVRTTGLFGHTPCRAKAGGRNFVETMLLLAETRDELTVVEDQRCCPTYVVDLAAQIRTMVDGQAAPGIYHAVNGPGCSWYDFARLILRTAGLRTPIRPVTSAAFPSPVRRPADSRLATEALSRAGLLRMRPLEVALADYLARKDEPKRVISGYARGATPPCTNGPEDAHRLLQFHP